MTDQDASGLKAMFDNVEPKGDLDKISAASDVLILSLRLKSGGFSSELHIPFPKTKGEQDRAVARWLDFMATGLRLSAEKMSATLDLDE